ncbi:hypothetical protein Tco_1356534 [Tanacetum coccineum]
MQLNKEIFQKNNISVNQTEPSFDQLFKLNNLKAELQAKDTTIEKLKANIKRLNKTSTTNSVKKDIDEIETINIELEHRVTKLIAENEHLKQTYKQLYDSIKPLRVQAKEHVESLVNQLNQKSVEITDLNAQLQEKDKNNRETHIYYLQHTMEQAAILREIVEQSKSLNPLDSVSYSALSRSTKSSRSKSTDNTKNDRILQISSSTQKKNKVEAHSRIVNSMFDARHELCFLEFVFDMNASSKSKSIKKAKKKEEWKPTGKVITATNKVPFREPIPLEVIAQESIVTKVYTRRPKVPNTNGSYSKPKIAKSNKTEPGTSRGSNTLVAPSSSSVDLSKDHISKIIGYGDYQIGNIIISRVYYVEGLRHNLFSVGQFCDLDLEVAFRKHTCFVRNLEGYAPKKKAYRIYNRRSGLKSMTSATSSSGLVPNPIPQKPYVSPVPVANAPRAVDLADSPVSTSIDQDAPLTSIPSTQDQEHSPIISQSFEESPKTPHFHDDLLYKFLHEDSTS